MAAVPCLFGAPQPITVLLQQISVGRGQRIPCILDRRLDLGRVMTIHVCNDMPSVGLEPLRRIVGEPARDLAVYGNPVVIVKHDQLAQPERACKRAGLMRDPLHQAAIARKYVGVVVDDVQVTPVEGRGQDLFRQRHAHRIGQALSQRAGRGFHARGVPVLRVPRSSRMQLPEVPDLFHGDVIPAQMQHRVQQHGAMAVGQDEAVAVRPPGVVRIVLQVVIPQHLGNVGHAHRHAGMTGIGTLHGIHAQCTNRVGKLQPVLHLGDSRRPVQPSVHQNRSCDRQCPK